VLATVLYGRLYPIREALSAASRGVQACTMPATATTAPPHANTAARESPQTAHAPASRKTPRGHATTRAAAERTKHSPKVAPSTTAGVGGGAPRTALQPAPSCASCRECGRAAWCRRCIGPRGGRCPACAGPGRRERGPRWRGLGARGSRHASRRAGAAASCGALKTGPWCDWPLRHADRCATGGPPHEPCLPLPLRTQAKLAGAAGEMGRCSPQLG
jgi:hypothetical protein